MRELKCYSCKHCEYRQGFVYPYRCKKGRKGETYNRLDLMERDNAFVDGRCHKYESKYKEEKNEQNSI